MSTKAANYKPIDLYYLQAIIRLIAIVKNATIHCLSPKLGVRKTHFRKHFHFGNNCLMQTGMPQFSDEKAIQKTLKKLCELGLIAGHLHDGETYYEFSKNLHHAFGLAIPSAAIDRPETAVYFLFNGGELVYIGFSKCPRTRVKHHLFSDKVFDEYTYIHVDRKNSRLVEAAYIEAYKPLHNKHTEFVSYKREIASVKIECPFSMRRYTAKSLEIETEIFSI